MVYNSKYGGGRMILNPTASLNDGLFELIFLKQDLGFGPLLKTFDACKKGGL